MQGLHARPLEFRTQEILVEAYIVADKRPCPDEIAQVLRNVFERLFVLDVFIVDSVNSRRFRRDFDTGINLGFKGIELQFGIACRQLAYVRNDNADLNNAILFRT